MIVSNRADGVRAAHPLFQEGGSGATPTSALQLRFVVIDPERSRELVKLWHSRLPVILRGNMMGAICYGAEFDGNYYAAAVWTNPVARVLPQRDWLELRRLAIAPDAPKNSASRILGWMARDIRKRCPHVVRLISYQDKEVHTGTIYKAAGWVEGIMTGPRSRPWKHGGRVRNQEQSKAPKQRWEKALRDTTESEVNQ